MRNNKAVVYCSSYDRGLEHLLDIWDDVIKEVPEATLHIYYGWQLFDKFNLNNPERMFWKSNILSKMNKPSIKHYGRIPQSQIIQHMENYGIWAYPCHFYEISCISAMKAQIAGCIPVTTNYAALESTVQYGVKVDGDIYDPKILEKYKQELISLLKDDLRQEKIRKEMMLWAKDYFSWKKVAETWHNLFKS